MADERKKKPFALENDVQTPDMQYDGGHPQSKHDMKITAEMERLRTREAEKRSLYDKSIGGAFALRPSDDFIRQNIGDPKGEAQLRREAEKAVWEQEKAEQLDRRNREDFDRSVRAHNLRLDRDSRRKDIEPGAARDQYRLTNNRGPDRGDIDR